MSFTPEEIRQWHEDKRKLDDQRWRHIQPQPFREQVTAICTHCQHPFGISAGVSTGEVDICDVCLGD